MNWAILVGALQADPHLRAPALGLRDIAEIGLTAVADLLTDVSEVGACSRQQVAAPVRATRGLA